MSVLIVAIGTAVADRFHPAIAATFEAREISPGTAIALDEARLLQPVTVTAGSFGLSQILPFGPIEVPGRSGQLLVRLRVDARDCKRLTARLGGSCKGTPKLVPMPEQLGITGNSDPLEARLETTPAAEASLGQNREEASLQPPREWSLTENAKKTTLTLTCLQPVALSVTRSSPPLHSSCSPDGPFFQLAYVNRKPYAPILAFDGSRTFQSTVAARRVEVSVDDGDLSFGDVQREVHEVEPTTVALKGSEPIEMRVVSPASEGVAATRLISKKTAEATVGEEDVVPSLLARDELAKSIAYGAILTLLIAALTYYARAAMARFSRKG